MARDIQLTDEDTQNYDGMNHNGKTLFINKADSRYHMKNFNDHKNLN